MRLVIKDGAPEGSENWHTQEEMRSWFEACLQLQARKAQTYGDAYRSQGYMGNMARVLSKVSRLRKMMWCDMQIDDSDESVQDTLMDLINISVFALSNLTARNKWGRDV